VAGKNYEIINTQFHDYIVCIISTTTHFGPTDSKTFAVPLCLQSSCKKKLHNNLTRWWLPPH